MSLSKRPTSTPPASLGGFEVKRSTSPAPATTAPQLEVKAQARKEFIVDIDGSILGGNLMDATPDAIHLDRGDVDKYFVPGIKSEQPSHLGRAFNNAKPPASAIAAIPLLAKALFTDSQKDQKLFDVAAFAAWGIDVEASPFTVAGEFQPGLVGTALPADKEKRDIYLQHIKSLFQQARTFIVDEKTGDLKPWLTIYLGANWLAEARKKFSETTIRFSLTTSIAISIASTAKESVDGNPDNQKNIADMAMVMWALIQRQHTVLLLFIHAKAKLEKTLATLKQIPLGPNNLPFQTYAQSIYDQCAIVAERLEKNPCTNVPADLTAQARLVNNISSLTDPIFRLECIKQFNDRFKKLTQDESTLPEFMAWEKEIGRVSHSLKEYQELITAFNKGNQTPLTSPANPSRVDQKSSLDVKHSILPPSTTQPADSSRDLDQRQLIAAASRLAKVSMRNLAGANTIILLAHECVNQLERIRKELNSEDPLLQTIGRITYERVWQLAPTQLATLDAEEVSFLKTRLSQVSLILTSLKALKSSELNAQTHSNTLLLQKKYRQELVNLNKQLLHDRQVDEKMRISHGTICSQQQSDIDRLIKRAQEISDLIVNAKKLEDQLEKYKKALDELAKSDPLFAEQKVLFDQRKQQVEQVLMNPNPAVAEVTALTDTLKSATATVTELVTLKEKLKESANEPRHSNASSIHQYATTVYNDGKNHAVELLKKPPIDVAYQTRFNNTLRDTATVVQHRNNLGNPKAITAVQNLNANTQQVQGASGGRGKKFWAGVVQLVGAAGAIALGAVATFLGVAASVSVVGIPLALILFGAGVLLVATGLATLDSNRQKGYSEDISNLTNAADKAKAEQLAAAPKAATALAKVVAPPAQLVAATTPAVPTAPVNCQHLHRSPHSAVAGPVVSHDDNTLSPPRSASAPLELYRPATPAPTNSRLDVKHGQLFQPSNPNNKKGNGNPAVSPSPSTATTAADTISTVSPRSLLASTPFSPTNSLATTSSNNGDNDPATVIKRTP